MWRLGLQITLATLICFAGTARGDSDENMTAAIAAEAAKATSAVEVMSPIFQYIFTYTSHSNTEGTRAHSVQCGPPNFFQFCILGGFGTQTDYSGNFRGCGVHLDSTGTWWVDAGGPDPARDTSCTALCFL